VTDPVGFNVGMTDRCGPAGAADLLIGDNDTRLDSPRLQRLVRWDKSCKRGSLRMRDWILGMAAAIFRLSWRSVFIQTLPSKEQREHEVTNSSWKLASMD
jgi:hypothetical protein